MTGTVVKALLLGECRRRAWLQTAKGQSIGEKNPKRQPAAAEALQIQLRYRYEISYFLNNCGLACMSMQKFWLTLFFFVARSTKILEISSEVFGEKEINEAGGGCRPSCGL